MVDLQDSPPIPPTDPGADQRLGWWIAGTLLILLGWGVGVVGNLYLHWSGGSGVFVGPSHFDHALGPFAWALVGFGLFTGALGVVLLAFARREPPGPFVLPGYPY